MNEPITRTHRVAHALQTMSRRLHDGLTEKVESAPIPWSDALALQQQAEQRRRDGVSLAQMHWDDVRGRSSAAHAALMARLEADTERGDL